MDKSYPVEYLDRLARAICHQALLDASRTTVAGQEPSCREAHHARAWLLGDGLLYIEEYWKITPEWLQQVVKNGCKRRRKYNKKPAGEGGLVRGG